MQKIQTDGIPSKVGVIIQGPLVSYGQGPNNKPEGFDTTDSILKNIENIKALQLPYIVCTWEAESAYEREILSVLESHAVSILTVRTPGVQDPDHRYKHHFGIRQAVAEIKNDYIIKIRTDMIMPDEFWVWITLGLDKRLVVSELITPFYLGDFIYAGERSTVIEFLDSILSHKGNAIHPSITTDLGFKYFEAQTGRDLSKYGMLHLYIMRMKHITIQWEHFAAKAISVVPAQIYQNIIWRDRPIKSIINIAAFKFDTSPPFHLLDTNFLLSEYIRYFSKRNDPRRYLVKVAIRVLKISTRFSRLFKKLRGHR